MSNAPIERHEDDGPTVFEHWKSVYSKAYEDAWDEQQINRSSIMHGVAHEAALKAVIIGVAQVVSEAHAVAMSGAHYRGECEMIWRKPMPFIDPRWHAFAPCSPTTSMCGYIYLVSGRGKSRKTMPKNGRCGECVSRAIRSTRSKGHAD